MFTWRHIVWLIICAVMVFAVVKAYDAKKPSLQQVLTTACIIAILSELTKMVSVIKLIPSANGELLLPYLPQNHLPLHFCSIQILLIFYTRFTANRKNRENVLTFMYPTCVCGAILALAMPSIFQTSISVEQAFTAPISYQFFIYHSMLIALGIIIARTDEIKWKKKHMYNTIITVLLLGMISIYLNSMLASPTYVDGELVSVDFWTNFFFTTQNPLGIQITQIWQWYLYLLIISVLAVIAISVCYIPIRKKMVN